MEITRAELDVLQSLREVEDRDGSPDEQVRHLTQALHVDEETVSGMLARLVRTGHVTVPGEAGDPESGPIPLYTLTRRGREALAAGPES